MADRFAPYGTTGAAKGDATAYGYRKKPCMFFVQGRCNKGEECTWSHDEELILKVMAEDPNGEAFRFKEPCRFFLQGTCTKGDTCVYAHVTEDPNTGTPVKLTEPCKFYAMGNCHKGDACRYNHEVVAKPQTPAEIAAAAAAEISAKYAPPAAGKGGYPPDWTCPACGDLQFARNTACRKCGTPKPVAPTLNVPASPALGASIQGVYGYSNYNRPPADLEVQKQVAQAAAAALGGAQGIGGYKKKMCKFFPLGSCTKGDACTYAHSQEEIDNSYSAFPAGYKKTLCNFYAAGSCTRGDACTYAHGEAELAQYTGQLGGNMGLVLPAWAGGGKGGGKGKGQDKTRLCKWWQIGECTSGDNCRFAHGEEELAAAAAVAGAAEADAGEWAALAAQMGISDEELANLGDEELMAMAELLANEWGGAAAPKKGGGGASWPGPQMGGGGATSWPGPTMGGGGASGWPGPKMGGGLSLGGHSVKLGGAGGGSSSWPGPPMGGSTSWPGPPMA